MELESVGLYIRVLLHKWVPPSSIVSLNKYGIRIGVFYAVAPFRREVFSSFYELQSHESPCRPHQRSLPFIRRLIPWIHGFVTYVFALEKPDLDHRS